MRTTDLAPLSLLVLCLVGCRKDGKPAEDPNCANSKFVRVSEGRAPPRVVHCLENAHCSDGVYCNGIELCRQGGTLCDCLPGTPPCDPEDFCDEINDVCIPPCEFPPDEDGDGVWSLRCGGTDCDDRDAARSPDQTEVCDLEGVDEDCDPSTVGAVDADGDGFITHECFNVTEDGDEIRGQDCDDMVRSTQPGQIEVCNGVDDDCDGDVDEEVHIPIYPDMDDDGWGVEPPMQGCAPQAGFALVVGDCDDTNAVLHPDQIRCLPPNSPTEDDYEVCLDDGTWEPAECPSGGYCLAQPDGRGLCAPRS